MWGSMVIFGLYVKEILTTKCKVSMLVIWRHLCLLRSIVLHFC